MDSELSADERNFILKSLIGNSGCPRRVAGICVLNISQIILIYIVGKPKKNPHFPHFPHLTTSLSGVRSVGSVGCFWL